MFMWVLPPPILRVQLAAQRLKLPRRERSDAVRQGSLRDSRDRRDSRGSLLRDSRGNLLQPAAAAAASAPEPWARQRLLMHEELDLLPQRPGGELPFLLLLLLLLPLLLPPCVREVITARMRVAEKQVLLLLLLRLLLQLLLLLSPPCGCQARPSWEVPALCHWQPTQGALC